MKLLFVCLIATLRRSQAHLNHAVYAADIAPISGNSDSATVNGVAVVFEAGDGVTVGYGGFVDGLGVNLDASCTGCNIAIHSGTSCQSTTTQNGPLFTSPITVDPWTEERYVTDEDGSAQFSNVIVVGTRDLEGRAMIVSGADGTRVGCGLLEMVNNTRILHADTLGMGDGTAMGVESESKVILFPNRDDQVCVGGNIWNLPGDVESTDCSLTNGCGTTIYSGADCSNATTLGEHYFNVDVVATDPWMEAGYQATDSSGNAFYVHCLTTGHASHEGRALVVHSTEGEPQSCGVLEFEAEGEGDHDEDHGSGGKEDGATSSNGTSISLILTFVLVGLVTIPATLW